MGRQGQSHKYGQTFLEQNAEYLLAYNDLRKQEKMWQDQSQYWLSREAGRRANALLRGNIAEYQSQKHSEHLYVKVNNKYSE